MAPIESVASEDSCEVAPDLIMDYLVIHPEWINLMCLELSLPGRMTHTAMPMDGICHCSRCHMETRCSVDAQNPGGLLIRPLCLLSESVSGRINSALKSAASAILPTS